jgi:hypothetical protein
VRLVIVAVLLLASAVGAAPTVTVRARTYVKIDQIVRTGNGVRVRGKLLDAGSGAGVASRAVVLDVGGEMQSTTTDADGTFVIYVDLAEGEHAIAARFGGDDLYGGSSFDPATFDVEKGTLALDLEAADVTLDDKGAAVRISVASRGGPEADVHIALLAGEQRTVLQPLERIKTGRDGVARVTIPRDKLGKPGEKRLVARFTGNDVFNPSEAETTFRLMTTTSFAELSAPQGNVAFESDLRVSGRLLDGAGDPVPDVLITLSGAGRRLTDTLTDARGGFRMVLAASELGPGPATLSVAHESRVPWRMGVEGTQFSIVIAEPRPLPIAYTVGAFLFTAGAVVGYVLYRTRPFRGLADRLRRRRRPQSSPEAVVSEEGGGTAPTPGLKPARPGIMSTLRRPSDTGFDGRVRDAVRGDGLSAQIVLVDGGAPMVVATDAHGNFAVEDLAATTWRVEVAAPGFVTERFTLTIPHRGELRGVRIDLLPVRERVFQVYRDVAARLLPKPALWGVWTPREIFDHVRAHKPAPALSELTGFVEEAYFSPRTPSEEILPVAEGKARAAQAEQASLSAGR